MVLFLVWFGKPAIFSCSGDGEVWRSNGRKKKAESSRGSVVFLRFFKGLCALDGRTVQFRCLCARCARTCFCTCMVFL
jgi:hypothetical protein